MKFTHIKQQHNTGRLLYCVTELGNFISYSTGFGRVIPIHVLYSGTRLKRKFIIMCLFRFLRKNSGFMSSLLFVWHTFNLWTTTACFV